MINYGIQRKHPDTGEWQICKYFINKDEATKYFDEIISCVGDLEWKGTTFRLVEVTEKMLAEVTL